MLIGAGVQAGITGAVVVVGTASLDVFTGAGVVFIAGAVVLTKVLVVLAEPGQTGGIKGSSRNVAPNSWAQ